MLSQKTLLERIDTAAKRSPADLVIKNGQIIDVFNGDIIEGDVAINDGVIVGIGSFEGREVVDAEGQYVCPGFIDGHVHIEAAMVSPAEFARVVLPHGVTTVIADPHEIANVGGVKAIEYMLSASDHLPLTVFMVLPSCVPCSSFEESGAALKAEQLAPFYQHDRVIGLGEVMDFSAVHGGDDDMLNKLLTAIQQQKTIDGHAAGLGEDGINVYTAAGIRTDHECDTVAAARIRLQRGMYLMIREGSVARDLERLIHVVNERNARRCLFVTDGKDIGDLLTEGSINHNVRLAIQNGLDPLLAIQMGTLNAAECFGLKHKGAIAPGYDADFLLLDDLETVGIAEVYCGGQLVAKNDRCQPWDTGTVTPPASLTDSVHMEELSPSDLVIPLGEHSEARVIKTVPKSLFTEQLVKQVDTKDGRFQPSVENDLLKLAVIERHKATGHIGLGIVSGLGLKSGAIASTFAHDSHNLIAVGTNDLDLLKAVHTVRDMQGGYAIVQNGDVLATLPLPIGGLMTDQDYMTAHESFKRCDEAVRHIGCPDDVNPFVMLSFLALPVIPELKLTAAGLFDVTQNRHVEVEVAR